MARLGQGRLGQTLSGKDAQPGDAMARNFNAQPGERFHCPPADKAAAQGIANLCLAFQQKRTRAATGHLNGGGTARRPRAYDDRICSTHNRNGKVRNTRAPRTPASFKIGGHSAGR